MLLAAGLLAVFAMPARADTLVLKNGNRFEGRVLMDLGSKVVFETDAGTITVRRSQIREIVKRAWVRTGTGSSTKPGQTKVAQRPRGKTVRQSNTRQKIPKAASRTAKKPRANKRTTTTRKRTKRR